MELTISQLIKIILGILVFVAVAVGLGVYFRNYVLDFFENISGGAILSLLK